ncbi:hypothetical protein [Micromonospora sp. NPDC047730]|uniref:restriction endonuclease subunit S n=1 Tax=Micromonospora sp. NPDC047730 TaxID=3364253 RepID=UPI00371EDBD7
MDGFTEAIQEIGYQGIRRGDLVVHAMDGFAGAVGVSDADGKASPVVHAYVGSEDVDVRYFAYVLRYMALNGYVSSLAKGIRERSTAFDAATLADVVLPHPPIEDQRRIADFLDGELARLGQIQGLRAAQRAQLDEHVQASISEAITPGILSGSPRHVRFPWLPALSDGVPLVRLGYLSRLQSGLTVDGARKKTEDDVTRPYLRVANVQAGYINLDSVTQITVPRTVAARSTLQPGDVLMTEGGDLDKLGRGTVWRDELPNCLHQNHVFALRVNKAQLDPDYLALATRSLHGRCYFESTGVKTTNLASTNSSKILSFPVPLPAIDRQRVIVAELGKELKEIERVRKSIERQMARLYERRQAIVAAAVTGHVDITTARGVDV